MISERILITAGALLCLVTAAACAAVKSGASPANDIPEVKKDCSVCHADRGTSSPGALKKRISELCIGCHAKRIAPGDHRVDIVPSKYVQGLPLTNGKMTCYTCHDPHKNPFGSLLRMKKDDLCLACHPV